MATLLDAAPMMRRLLSSFEGWPLGTWPLRPWRTSALFSWAKALRLIVTEILSILPPAEIAYLEKVTQTLQLQLQHNLVAVYLFGSAAYGEYEVGLSDLDAQAVSSKSLDTSDYLEIVAHLQHSYLPCPARRLEFVLYQENAIRPASRHP